VGGNCFAFVNEGDAGGASQPHAHSQLAWLPESPRAGALPPHAAVLERDGLLLACPLASRASYELMVAPVEAEPSGLESELLAPALRLLAGAVRRLHELAGERLPLNVWLLGGRHWRLELLPRGTRFAGLEL